MPDPRNQTPEQREAELAAMRAAEQRALEELRANPTGSVEASGLSQEDVELVAMLAGTTNQEMKKARFADNVMAPSTQRPVDPREVIQDLRKTGGPVTPRPGAPLPPRVQQPAQVPAAVTLAPVSNDPQLELPFRDANLNDVNEALELIRQRLGRMEETQKIILDFIKRVEAE